MKKSFVWPVSFLLMSVIVLGSKCEPSKEYRDYRIVINNSSGQRIGYYYARKEEYGDNFPESLPATSAKVISDMSGSLNLSISLGNDRKYFFKNEVPRDSLFIFFFSTDTLLKYSWEDIRDEYKVLKRYDMSYSDLEKLNWRISYPPTEAMKNIKQYPPY